ncbi:MFS transporter [Hyphococcus luteus]|uniref:Major facilitator superfamily (MFS) profile domain-containing protein n=1 Tax=Hyphococcus luteus TaxID=2058213 RepID=A0A2S7K1P4_9PROT|nr:MFS transporter [Marinicaulis flavus]PQA86416.1 hypothetical protein CW354_18985 [Marinicaulis flavus]
MRDDQASDNPAREVIAQSPMSLLQFLVVGLCCLINMSEGYDVLSLGLAAPELTKEWSVSPEILGLAFSATSVGLALGAFFVAPVADRVGRRTVILAAVAIITVVHWLSAIAGSIWVILALRFVMGLGLGTLVVSLNVMVSEFSNERWRNLLIASLHTGFSIGMALSGLVAANVLDTLGWRYIFVAGGVLNCVVLILGYFFLLESPEYLTSQQPRNALQRINKVLGKLNFTQLDALPPKKVKTKGKPSFALLLSEGMRTQTILIWVASFAYAIVGYFLMNWKPQVLVNAGLTPVMASYVGVLNGVFGVVGHISIAILTKWFDNVKLTAAYFALLTVALIFFGMAPPAPWLLLTTAGVMTMFTVGAYTGVFLVAINIYTVEMRNTGVGYIVGWGRVGSILGPMLGGLLVGAGLGRMSVFAVFAVISVIPALTMLLAGGGRLTADEEAEQATA